MAGGFQGMNPEEGHKVASVLTKTGSTIQAKLDELRGKAQGVQWVGPDAEKYKSEFQSFINGEGKALATAYTNLGKQLDQQAKEQESTSSH